MKTLSFLALPEKIMLSVLIVLISLLAFSAYGEKHKHVDFINNIQDCSEEAHFHAPIISQD